MVMFYALVVLALSGSTMADIIGWGACPDVQTMPDFDITKTAGTWYAAKMYFKLEMVFVKCVKAEIRPGPNDTMLLDGYGTSRMSGKVGVIHGIELKTLNASDPGKIEIKFPFKDWVSQGWVLGTDYDSFLVGYRCIDLKLVNLKRLTIVTRDQHPSEATMAKAMEVIKKQNLNPKFLLPASQEGCGSAENSTRIQSAEEVKSFY